MLNLPWAQVSNVQTLALPPLPGDAAQFINILS